MKTAIELLKESQSITIDELLAIANCKRMTKDVYTSRDMLKAHEIVSLLAFRELEKALRTDEYQLILDCNYANSRSSDLRLLVYRYDVESAHIQLYIKVKKESIAFDICTSCKEKHREAFDKRIDTLKFKTSNNKSERKQVAYDELVDVIKSLIALFYEVNNKSTESATESTESTESTATESTESATETKTESTEKKTATKRRKKKASATESTESTTATATESAEIATA